MGSHEVLALDDVSLNVEQGDFVAIMGPSGSGKSTLAQILGLLDVPSHGLYKINGKDVSSLAEDAQAILRRSEIGFIFQQFNLLPRMSALENVMLPLFYSEKEKSDVKAKILLERVGLGSRLHHKPNELSGGQQQRIAIARSLINEPQIIFADEPTGNLDSQSEKEIMQILKELNDQGITVIMVTHEEEIGAQAKRLIRMRDGRIISDERKTAFIPRKNNNPKISMPVKNQFFKVFEHLRQGLKTLSTNKVRTGLSLLGILIGVAAVVAMLALGKGAQKSIEAQLSSLGSNLLVLRSGSMRIGGVASETGTTARISLEDAKDIKNYFSSVKNIAPSVSGRGQVTYLNKNWNTQIQGSTSEYAQMRASKPEIGRFFNEEENRKRARVAVVGLTPIRELFGNVSPIGEMIKINKIPFQIIGILPEKGSNGFRDQDDTILIPINTAMQRLLGKDYVDSIDMQIENAQVLESTQENILEFMYARKKVPFSQRQTAFEIRNMAEIQQALSQSSKTMSVLLAFIAAISLLVGGIGIMNIMLVSVTERTKEIGLRKAIGAKGSDILFQFLAESIVVSVVGGLFGIILGWSISTTLSLVTGWTTEVSLASVLLSFFFSVFIGITFGIYPARKASLLHPIQALRYE